VKSEALVFAATALFVVACDRRPKDAPDASAVPWQPHGLRVPTTHCEFDVPAGWTRSVSPMPDHIAELSDGNPKSVIIIEERVEPDVASAREASLAYYRSSVLRAGGASTIADGPLEGARARGHVLSMRWGTPNDGSVETVSFLSFTGVPVVDVVARYEEANTRARDAAAALVRSMRCTK